MRVVTIHRLVVSCTTGTSRNTQSCHNKENKKERKQKQRNTTQMSGCTYFSVSYLTSHRDACAVAIEHSKFAILSTATHLLGLVLLSAGVLDLWFGLGDRFLAQKQACVIHLNIADYCDRL